MAERVKSITKAWARRVVRSATPEKLEELANNERWWTEAVLSLVLDRVDTILADSATEGLAAAKTAAKLGSRILDLGNESKAQLLAVLGSAYRRVGDYKRAEQLYAEALALPGVGRKGRAVIFQRYAVFLIGKGRRQEALRCINEALSAMEDPQMRAGALVTRAALWTYGYNNHNAAIRDVSEALSLADRNTTTFVCAARNLAFLLTESGGDSKSLETAALLIREARRVLMETCRGRGGSSYQARHYPMGMLAWVEGLILARLGSHRRALRSLESARSWLAESGQVEDCLVAILDLVGIQMSIGETARALKECIDGIALAERCGMDLQASALTRCLESLKTRAEWEAQVAATRRQLQKAGGPSRHS